jgi:DNA-binding transcriptional MerR regulator
MKTKKHYTMKELSALVDMTARNIRFYIQQEIVDKPHGQNKGAYYTEIHMRQLLTVKKYKDAGVSLERIAQIIHEDEATPQVDYKIKPGNIEVISSIHLMDGLELTINPEKSGLTQQDIRKLSRTLLETIETLQKEKNND